MKKTSALALAIAGTIAAPAAMAESGYYMSARLGVDMNMNDDATQESTTFGNLSSRMGWRMETDLGNGKTAYGKYEVSLTSLSTRDLYVGLKGDFGDIKVAEAAYTAFYNNVTGPVDQPYWVGGKGIVKSGTGRTHKAISYMGGTDAFSFEVTGEADGTDTTTTDGNTGLSGYQIGATIGLGDWSVGLGARNSEDTDPVNGANTATDGTLSGIVVSGGFGDIGLALSFMTDDTYDGSQLHATFGSFFFNYGQLDDGNTTPSTIAVGYSRSIGRNTSFWVEAASNDSDGGNDSQEVVGAIRYDWN